jgi:hypothetical protein
MKKIAFDTQMLASQLNAYENLISDMRVGIPTA